MSANRQRCPECDSPHDVSDRRPGERIRCPDCGETFPVRKSRTYHEDRLRSEPEMRRAPRESDAEDNDRPVRRVRSVERTPNRILIPLGIAAGAIGMLLMCGGLGMLLYWNYSSASGPASRLPAPPDVAGAAGVKAPIPAPDAIRAPGGGGATLPVATLEALKKASVFIKLNSPIDVSTGSGFVVYSADTTVYVVTNHHVITPTPPEDEDVPAAAFPGAPPGFPRPRFAPRLGRPRMPIGPVPRTIMVVFNSGTPKEQSVQAEVVADEAETDLAVLRVHGVNAAPAPIDCRTEPKLIETMPVLIFGFPFGEALAENRRNPTITVTQGTVSSLRNDDQGELSSVQIDGDVNPGNSGGPMVDTSGRLVGVVKAKIRGSKIGMAVPTPKLQRLLSTLDQGRRVPGP